jgi:hypothetical protein
MCASHRQQQGRNWTLSIAVPGSIIDNTQNAEFATFVAGQIARAAAIFNVDEVHTSHALHTSVSSGIGLSVVDASHVCNCMLPRQS